MKRAVTKTFHHPETNHRQEIFLDKSSSSSITEDDDEVTSLNQNRLIQSDEHENATLKSRHSNGKKDKGGSMIEELLQSNMDLKYVLRQRKTRGRFRFDSIGKKFEKFVDKLNIIMELINKKLIEQFQPNPK